VSEYIILCIHVHVHKYVRVYSRVCIIIMGVLTHIHADRYGVAMISRLLQIIGLFAEYRLLYRALLQKKHMILRSLPTEATTYNFDYQQDLRIHGVAPLSKSIKL